MKKKVYHVGDEIRIVTPSFVERVGYPLTKKIVKETLIQKEDTDAINALLSRYYPPKSPLIFEGQGQDKNFDEILDVIAGVIMRRKGWGGKQRSLHLIEKLEFKDRTCRVLEKKVVQTGEYVDGWSSYDSYSGEHDSVPACLSNRKDFVLLKVYLIPDRNTIGSSFDEYWIQEQNVIPFDYNEQ